MKEDSEDPDAALGRQLSFRNLVSSLQCVRLLSETPEFERFLVMKKEGKPTLDSSPELLEGYKFAILVSVYYLMEEAVDTPTVFGIEPLPGLDMTLHWGDGAFPIPQGDAPHELLVRNMWWIRTELISARTWEDFRKAVAGVSPILSAMDALIGSSYVAIAPPSSSPKEVAEIAPLVTVDYLHVYYHDFKNAQFAYSEIYRSSAGSASRGTSTRPPAERSGTSPRDTTLLRGFSVAVEYLWWRVLGPAEFDKRNDLLSKISLSATWEDFDALFGALGGLTKDFLGPYSLHKTLADGLDFRRVRDIPSDSRAVLLAPAPLSMSVSDRLSGIFELRPVRVGPASAMASIHYFIFLFTGLVTLARKEGSKVRVIRFKHRESPGNAFSYALFVPVFGALISNASEYWLTLRAATDYSGTGNATRLELDALFNQNQDVVEVRDFDIDPLEDLERFAESRPVKFLHSRVKEFEDLLGAFRGVSTELIVAELLRREGLEIIDLRRRLKWLGGKEVDVIAADTRAGMKILLVECKASLEAPPLSYTTGAAILDEAEGDMRDVLSFVAAVKVKAGDAHGLFQELKLSGTGDVVPVIAAVGDVDEVALHILSRDAMVWDWDNLKARLTRAKLARGLWDPLEHFAAEDEVARRSLNADRELFSYLDVSRNK
ncbi:MAG: hypothetical protein ACLPQ4_04155 [Thermoplasmata archaeon]